MQARHVRSCANIYKNSSNDAMSLLGILKCIRSLVQFLLVPFFIFLAWHNMGLESGLGDATSLR